MAIFWYPILYFNFFFCCSEYTYNTYKTRIKVRQFTNSLQMGCSFLSKHFRYFYVAVFNVEAGRLDQATGSEKRAKLMVPTRCPQLNMGSFFMIWLFWCAQNSFGCAQCRGRTFEKCIMIMISTSPSIPSTMRSQFSLEELATVLGRRNHGVWWARPATVYLRATSKSRLAKHRSLNRPRTLPFAKPRSQRLRIALFKRTQWNPKRRSQTEGKQIFCNDSMVMEPPIPDENLSLPMTFVGTIFNLGGNVLTLWWIIHLQLHWKQGSITNSSTNYFIASLPYNSWVFLWNHLDWFCWVNVLRQRIRYFRVHTRSNRLKLIIESLRYFRCYPQ